MTAGTREPCQPGVQRGPWLFIAEADGTRIAGKRHGKRAVTRSGAAVRRVGIDGGSIQIGAGHPHPDRIQREIGGVALKAREFNRLLQSGSSCPYRCQSGSHSERPQLVPPRQTCSAPGHGRRDPADGSPPHAHHAGYGHGRHGARFDVRYEHEHEPAGHKQRRRQGRCSRRRLGKRATTGFE
jgi:hypothetical protein